MKVDDPKSLETPAVESDVFCVPEPRHSHWTLFRRTNTLSDQHVFTFIKFTLSYITDFTTFDMGQRWSNISNQGHKKLYIMKKNNHFVYQHGIL